MDKNLTNLYVETNTPNGIPTKSVLDEWLKSTLSYEESKGRLTIMDRRKKEFQEEYRKFAPIGAMLKKMERQITVAEQEYLELLHGLSLAKLEQQNNELTSKLTIVDPAFLPLKPNASQRKIQIIIGALAGFIIVLAVILTGSLINKTVQEPAKAIKVLGIPLLGIYPLLNQNAPFIAKANMRLLQKLFSKISPQEDPVTVGVVSIQKGEGKTTIIDMWTNELTRLNYKVENKTWDGQKLTPSAPGTNYVFIEFPPLDNMMLFPGSIPHLDHTFLLCRANRIWSKIDKEMLAMFSKANSGDPLAILNGVDSEFAEEYIGEVPKKRNLFRAFLKRGVKFQFGDKKKLRK